MAFGGNSSFGTSGGGGSAPAVGDITGLGTGVATALGVNVGSAGAPVVFNGALGTPSSGTLTNCTFPSTLPTGTLDRNLSTKVELWDDFLGDPSNSTTIPSGGIPLWNFGSGTGAGISAVTVTDENSLGVWRLTTGTTNTGYAVVGSIINTVSHVRLGGGAFAYETRVRFATLSDGTDTYTFFSGFSDSANGNGTDAVMFRYIHSENSGKFVCVTRSNSTETTADSGITVAINTWYRLRIEVNAAANSVSYFINSSSAAATISTNIPTGSGRETAFRPIAIAKSAGTTARTVDADYAYLKWVPSVAR